MYAYEKSIKKGKNNTYIQKKNAPKTPNITYIPKEMKYTKVPMSYNDSIYGCYPLQCKTQDFVQQLECKKENNNQFVAQRRIVLNEEKGLTKMAIENAKNIGPYTKNIIEYWDDSINDKKFESLEDFYQKIIHILEAEMVHDEVSDLLRIPVNVLHRAMENEENKAGKEVALKILNIMYNYTGIPIVRPEKLEVQDYEDFALIRMIHQAAAAYVTSVAVCDNYASLSALLLRTKGVENVMLRGAGGHKYATIGETLIDPWTYLVHNREAVFEKYAGDINLNNYSPHTLDILFNYEVENCKEYFDNALDELTDQELDAFQELIHKRKDGLGDSSWRKNKADEELAEKAVRAKKREQRKKILEDIEKKPQK